MTSLIVGLLALAADAEVPAQPVAMVLASKGSVVVARGDKDRPVTEMDLLLPGDVVRVKTGGTAKIVVLGDGHREEIPPGVEVKLAPEGCQPPESVKREAPKLSQVQLANLRKMAQSQRGGVVVIRSGNNVVPATRRSPISGTTVLTVRPSFQWEELPDVLGYRVELFAAQGGTLERQVWKREAGEPKLVYPEDAKPLAAGMKYRWQVTALRGGDEETVIVNARLTGPSEGLGEQVNPLVKMARGEDPAEWLLAATTLESMGVYEAALPIFERLAEKFPEKGQYHEVLAEYYQRAGESEKARVAAEMAKKLKP